MPTTRKKKYQLHNSKPKISREFAYKITFLIVLHFRLVINDSDSPISLNIYEFQWIFYDNRFLACTDGSVHAAHEMKRQNQWICYFSLVSFRFCFLRPVFAFFFVCLFAL